MRKRFLTPQELQELDPSGVATAKIRHLLSITQQTFERFPEFFTQTSDELWEQYQTDFAKFGFRAGDGPYLRYCEELRSKCGRQGGHLQGKVMLDLISPYYEVPVVRPSLYLEAARDFVIKCIRQRIDVIGYPQLYEKLGVVGTWSGLPAASVKGGFDAETLGMKPGFRKALPPVPGTRFMRGKPRIIFQSANPNVRLIERFLSTVRRWLREQFPEWFGSWLNEDAHVRPTLTRWVKRGYSVFEGDYQAMDTNFCRELAQRYVYPIVEAVLGQLPYSVQSMFDQMFETPLFMGDYVLEGEHTLFSGEVITNDFETIFTVVLIIATAMAIGESPNRVGLVALGDDSAVTLHKRDRQQMVEYAQAYCEISATAGEVVHPLESGKSRVASGEVRYCRKVYYTSARADECGTFYGAYPSVLTMNNICRPEKLQTTPETFWGATFQRLDGLYGSRDWAMCVQRVLSVMPRSLRQSATFLGSMTAPEDWWSRVYGVSWDVTKSPTAGFAKSINLFQR